MQQTASSPALRAVARRLLATLSAGSGPDAARSARVALWARLARACASPETVAKTPDEAQETVSGASGEASGAILTPQSALGFVDLAVDSALGSAVAPAAAAQARALAIACLPGLGARLAPVAPPVEPSALLGKTPRSMARGSSSSAVLAAQAAELSASGQADAAQRDLAALGALRDWLLSRGALSPVDFDRTGAASPAPAPIAPAAPAPAASASTATAATVAAPASRPGLGQRMAQAHQQDAQAIADLRALIGPLAPGAPEGLAVEPDWRLLAQASRLLAQSLDREARPVGAPFRRLMGALAMLGAVSDRSPPLARAFSFFGAASAHLATQAARAFLSQDPAERESGPSGSLFLSQLHAQGELADLAVSALREAHPRAGEALRSASPPPVATPSSAAPLAAAAESESTLRQSPLRPSAAPGNESASLIREPLARLDPTPEELAERAERARAAETARQAALQATQARSAALALPGFWGDPQALWDQAAHAGFEREGERAQLDWAQEMAKDPRAWKGKDFGVLAWAEEQDELARPNQIADWGPFIVFLLMGWPFGGLFGSVFSGLCFYRPAKRSFSNLARAFVALRSLPDSERRLLMQAPGFHSFMTRNLLTAGVLIIVNIGSLIISSMLMHSLSGMGGAMGGGAGGVDMKSIQGVLGALGGG